MAVRDDRGDVKQTTTGFRGPLMVQSLTSAKSKFLSLSDDSEEHLGQSSDGGVDGVIRQDALGLERIYVQAKRYAADNSVGAPSVRNFTGALEGFSASGGVFITTSRFSSEALAFVERLSRPIVLIDGEELGRLMVEYGVGVTTTQTLHVHEVDENFFEEQ